MAPSLTAGSINRILNGEEVSNPVIQILGCKKIPGAGNDRYRLLISDGITGYPFAMLGTQLNQMVTNKELEKFTVIRVNRCVCNQVQADRKVIILLNFTILNPGIEVERKLGNPISFMTDSSTSSKHLFQPHQNVTQASRIEPETGALSDTELIKFLNLETYTMVPRLTAGSINKILNGEEVSNPVIQILGCKKLPNTEERNDRYRLLISDGITGCPFAMLGTQLNQMVTNKELEKFTVIRVDRCVCNQVQADRKVIILLSLTVLVPGNEINEKLGNPINSTVPSSAAPSENGANGTVPTETKPLSHPY